MRHYVNCACLAIIAWGLIVVLHEATHGALALAFGARLNFLCLWSTGIRPPDTWSVESWQMGVVQGAAAIGNILMGVLAARLFSNQVRPPFQRIFWYYVTAFSWILGFGYLASDPLTAGPDSHGDWAKVVMLLGGSWGIRIPIFAVGCLGVIWTVMWLRRGLGMLSFSPLENDTIGRRILILLVTPYFAVNTAFTLLSFTHPTAELRGIIAAIVCWGSNFMLLYAALASCFYKNNLQSLTNGVVPAIWSKPILMLAILGYVAFALISVPWNLGWQW